VLAKEVRFYVFTKLSLVKVLKELLEKTLMRGQRAVVLVSTKDEVESLCSSLWTVEQKAFLPHGSAVDGRPERQLVWITHQLENPNQASVAFIIPGFIIPITTPFALLIILVDGLNPQEIETSNAKFLDYRSQGLNVKYYLQNESGKWQEKT